MGRWAQAKFLASPAAGLGLGKDVPGEGVLAGGRSARRKAPRPRCSAGSCAVAKQRLQRTQDMGRALGGEVWGRGHGGEIFRAVLGEEAMGKAGGVGGEALRSALSRVRALLPAVGRGARRGPADQTPVGAETGVCQTLRAGLAAGAARARVAAVKCPLSPEKGFSELMRKSYPKARIGAWDPAGPEREEILFPSSGHWEGWAEAQE